MSPDDIIELPGQPGKYARRAVADAWVAAGSPPVTEAGRLYARQKYLYDGWARRLPGFNPADNPDQPWRQLAHVRFTALDIDPTPTRVRRLTAAGLVRPYSYEPWHWQLPGDVRRFPLVTSIPAGGTATPLPQEEDMFDGNDRATLAALAQDRAASGGVQLYERVGAGPQEWMIVDPTLPPLEADPKQDGYRVTLDGTLARIWGRQYSGSDKIPVHVTRDEYIAAQEWARQRAAEHRAAQVAIVREALREAAP